MTETKLGWSGRATYSVSGCDRRVGKHWADIRWRILNSKILTGTQKTLAPNRWGGVGFNNSPAERILYGAAVRSP